jgi:hypothetical protein
MITAYEISKLCQSLLGNDPAKQTTCHPTLLDFCSCLYSVGNCQQPFRAALPYAGSAKQLNVQTRSPDAHAMWTKSSTPPHTRAGEANTFSSSSRTDMGLWSGIYEGVSKSFRTGLLERELQMVQLFATRCSCIAILWVSLVSFDAITLCVASQRVFIVVSIYFVMTQSGNFWIHSRASHVSDRNFSHPSIFIDIKNKENGPSTSQCAVLNWTYNLPQNFNWPF